MSSSSSSVQYTPVSNNKVPLPPVTAERYHVTCRFCNVGCGYDVFVFPVGQEGGPAAGQNAIVYNMIDKVFNRNLQNYQADYTSVLPALSANSGTPWIGEGMVSKTIRYNPNTQTWEEVYILEVPSSECPVNEGNYSTRGGRNAQRIWSPFNDVASGFRVYETRIKTPLIRWNGTLQAVGWSYVIEAIAQILYYYLTNETTDYPVGPAATEVMAIRADHGGGEGGGVFSNLMPGLFLHMGLATPFVRFHYQVAFSLTEDALMEATNGKGTDTSSMLDISITDVMVMWGINEYVTSTVNLIQHIFDNLRGATQSRKQQWFEPGEPTPPGMAIVVEARPSETAHAVAAAVGCTVEEAINGTCNVGKSQEGLPQVLVVQVNPGTDTELINAVAAYIYYTYGNTTVQNFINMYQQAQKNSNNAFTFNNTNYQYYLQYLQSKSLSDWLSEAEQITGVPQNIIQMMGDMLAKPKVGSNGQNYYKRVVIEFEKGVIWSGNYTPIYSLANLAIIIGALSGRPGCGISTGFGHQRGAAFPLPPPPPWYTQIGLSLNQGRMLWIQMSQYVPQQLQKQGMTINGSNIAEFIKNFYSQYTSSLVPQIYQYNPVIDYLIYSGYGKVLWVFTAVPYKLTMAGGKLSQTINHRSKLLQECVENTLSSGVPSGSTSSIISSSPYYNTSAVSSTIPQFPDPDTYAQAVISCLSGSNKQPGALFIVGNDIILNQNGLLETAAHIILPSAANHGETYEIRWNGHDRRLRLIEPFHSPPGMAMPDVWIYAMIAYRLYQLLQQNGMGSSPQAQRIYQAFNQIWTSLKNNMMQNSQPLSLIPEFSEFYYDYNWFNIYSDIWDYYVANGPTNFSSWPYGYLVPHWFVGWSQMSLSDLKATRTIGVQLPILGKTTNPDGSFTLWGLVNYAEPGIQGAINGQFRAEAVTVNPNQSVTVGNTQLPLITREIKYININDLQSMFGYDYNTLMQYVIDGLNPFPMPYVGVFGYAAQLQQKYKYWVNNGRWNIIFQSGWTDFQVSEIYRRVPFPIIAVSQQDAMNEGWNNGDLLMVYNDWGSITGVAWISNTVAPGQVFIAMAYPTSPGANQLTSPTVDPVTDNQMVKWAWANIVKIGTLPQDLVQQITFAPVQFNVPSSSSSS
ncbi:molybdopterin dinucleotide-binding protein [Sulfolobus sp. S-194]|uniref:molybdopterin dinucleotide binding domain-containing protein n=1 Tax=Sulfolobus sp. S-194 TaxID=2512240 RepID=UPI001436F779|nr:molybdopterin dinucleotide binding domain-containing protein [Sulfolobus sp. S-194]QIW25169.1 molybdopterin dinucleotide-binding protein [Sulfolobus sp. S-194]